MTDLGFRRPREKCQWGGEGIGLEKIKCRAVWDSESRDQGWLERLGLLVMTDRNRGIKGTT